MRSAVTVSLVPEARGGPFVFWNGLADACAQAAALGFDALEIFPPGPEALDSARVEPTLRDHRLELAAVGTGAGWVVRKLTLTHPEPAVRAQARAFISDMLTQGARLGAPTIIGSMQGRAEGNVSRAQALTWLAESLEELGALAGRLGTVLLYEPLNRYETNLLNRLDDSADFLRSLRTRQVRILADLFHLGIEESNVPDALRRAGSLIGHVHFADSNRQAVGFGHTPMPPIIDALRAIGYHGYLSAEVLPLPDSLTAARQTQEAFRKI